MVSSVTGDSDGAESVHHKRRRMNRASPLTPAQQRQTARHRKQKLMSKLSDSGFEEDLGSSSSPSSSTGRTSASPLRGLDKPEAAAEPEQLSNWYLQYGDIGYSIQREKETQFHPCKSLARQPQLTAEARCKLVSWLIPVHKHFHLSFECCCLAVNIMDRFLASTAVAADCFQLLGVTALLLASKQVEVFSPRISHLLSLCCDAFTKEQLCNLECLILLRLNFRLAAPTLAFFLDYYTNCIKAAHIETYNTGDDRFAEMNPVIKTKPQRCSNLARKVCELSLADYAFNKYPPSLTASCALRLASELLKTEQGFVEPQEVQWDNFLDELCAQPVPIHPSEGSSLIVTDQLLSGSGGQEICNHNLAWECKDNLKLLVSLNQEALEVMSSM